MPVRCVAQFIILDLIAILLLESASLSLYLSYFQIFSNARNEDQDIHNNNFTTCFRWV
jgi:hypothetical protein